MILKVVLLVFEMPNLTLPFRSFNKLLLIIGLVLFSSFSVFSQLVPQMKCVEVLPNGNTVITWQAPNDPGGLFFSYEVFWVDAGTEVQLAEIFDYNTTSYTHVGAQANIASREYKVRTKSGLTGQFVGQFSQSAFSMFLQVNAAALNAIALLSWNKPLDPISSSSQGFYEIYREYPVGNWVQIGTAIYNNESFSDTIQAICADPPINMNYRIELVDDFGCTSVSSVDGALLTDAIGPTPPAIETVSIDTLTNEVVICWYPSPQPDTDGYFIQNITGPNYITVGNTNDPNVLTFNHNNSESGSLQYVVIAYDECDNDESFGFSHQSIFVSATLNECEQEVTLQWAPYQGWPEGVESYNVRAQINGEPSVVLASYSGNTLNATIPVDPYNEYCFFIWAESNGVQKPALSNKFCLESTYPPIPQYLYLNRVNVLSETEIEINMLPDPLAFGVEYRLERKTELESEFEEIGVMAPVPLSELYFYIDSDNINTNEFLYNYRIAAYDACGTFAGYTNEGKNVLLRTQEDSEEYLSKLQWNDYQGWNGDVAEYNIYRSISREGPMELLATVPSNVNYYEDNVFDLINTHGEFCYYIEAVENLNEYNRADVVISNTSCAVQKPLFWIPNAFVVGGFNDVFKPVTGYIDFERYEMQIFSRWGGLIFSSSDINEGWNGIHKGKIAPEGAYVYYITIRAGDGQTFEESGTVILLNGN
jgi:gliding motility-associated-like protein